MNNDFKQEAKQVDEIIHTDLVKELKQEEDKWKKDELFLEIRSSIQNFIKKLDKSEFNPVKNKKPKGMTIENQIKWLEGQKELIYEDFFRIQNLINLYVGRKIVMSFVITDDNGYRKIITSENDATHLGVQTGHYKWKEYAKISYDMDQRGRLLKNSLPEEDNKGLQEAAKEVERRYTLYKKRVLWKASNSNWKGYTFWTKGPINEAFVNFYVHDIKMLQGLEDNIDTFMLNKQYGAIMADATKGFMIGDVERDGIQYAVKGAFGSPQGVIDVIKSFYELLENDFSEESFGNLIKKYTTDEYDKTYSPQIRELAEEKMKEALEWISTDPIFNNK